MSDPTKHLKAAMGYLDLGMAQEAWDELEKLPPLLKDRDSVNDLKIEIYQRLGKWESAGILAESLAKRSPENPNWWIQWAFSVRREKSVEAAQAVMREAAQVHPDMPLIPYSLACYSCVLGDLETARTLLEKAFSMSAHLRRRAINDPDLRPIFGNTP
jgi:Flp pilus assembly protein TadD